MSLASAVAETNTPTPSSGRLPGANIQYLLFNCAPGQGMNQGIPETLGRKQFEEVLAHFPNRPLARWQTGLSYIFNCEGIRSNDTVLKSITQLVETSERAGSQTTP
jgi:hypothetical protein